jgi:hypothetical protein
MTKKNTPGGALTGMVLGLMLISSAIAHAQSGAAQSPINDASARGGMAVYKDYTKYPPDSRPLDSSNWDLLHPWLTDSSPLPMIPNGLAHQMDSLRTAGFADEEIMSRIVIPPGPRYQFDMNKTVLAGTEDQLEARLTVTPGRGFIEPPRVHITKAVLTGDDAFGNPPLGTVSFTCEDQRPVCTFHWKAPSAEKQYWGVLDLVVDVTVEGAADSFVVRQSFYSSPMVAGRFTGKFQEKLQNGSLIVDVGVAVQKRMACFVSGNLYSVDKEVPAVHAERRMIVDPSMKTIALTFFGKIFRDFGHEGAFRLQDLKTQCENLPYPPEWFMDSLSHQVELQAFQNNPPATREPTRIYFAYSNATYTTQRYASGVFSEQEWQSPEKNRKIEAFKKAAADLDDPAKAQRKQELQKNLTH